MEVEQCSEIKFSTVGMFTAVGSYGTGRTPAECRVIQLLALYSVNLFTELHLNLSTS
jgi:hypothetical protein